MDVTSRCNLKCRMCYFAVVDTLRFPPFDQDPPAGGAMTVEDFEKIAADLFPRAHRVALGCSAEPMMHPKIREILEIAGRHGVPDLWFPTNLLALTEKNADAIIDAGVRALGVSIDGVDRETYEDIRVKANWDRLLDRLEMLRRMKQEKGSKLPRLRLIFTWMKSNYDHLRRIPEFAADHGFVELDIRFVARTVEVDVTPELLEGVDAAELDAELDATAKDAVRRGLRLASFPGYTPSHSGTAVGKLGHRLWRIRAGLSRPEYWRHAARKKKHGCAYPDRTLLIRPNGTVLPCPFWQEGPIGWVPRDNHDTLASAPLLHQIKQGLSRDEPIGTCDGCERPWGGP